MDPSPSHRPSISASSSTSSCSSASSIATYDFLATTMPSFSHYTGSSAPMPSPLAHQENTYFAPHTRSQTQQALLAQQQQASQQEQSRQSQSYRQSLQYPQSHSQRQPSLSSSAGSEASFYLKDFNLLAEAAKRAQVACVTRDFEEFGL